MTKQEIQALIDSKIAGQGTAVDLGGALPTILHEILEAAFAGENVQSNWNENDSQSPQFIQNKPTIPAPYSLPVASAETLGGVKVGTGLNINEDGVLSGAASPLMVELNIAMDRSASIVGTTTKRQILEALQSGRPVVGYVPGPYGVDTTYLCRLSELGNANGDAVFFGVTRAGAVEYCYVDNLGS